MYYIMGSSLSSINSTFSQTVEEVTTLTFDLQVLFYIRNEVEVESVCTLHITRRPSESTVALPYGA